MLTLIRRGFLAAALATGTMTMTMPLTTTPAVAAAVHTLYKSVDVGGVRVAYREAGPKDAPVVLLLHGFPSSSHMFRDLIPKLADTYRVIAPDYPGFGQSDAPDLKAFPYTFAAMADLIDQFTVAVGANSYVVYMQDYGGPVGLRLAVAHPERVRGFIVQNAVASVESWNPDAVAGFAPFWTNRTPETEKPIRGLLTAETTRFQYTQGASRPERLSPDAWVSDQANLDKPGNADLQLAMLFDYQDNIAHYPVWKTYLEKARPPMLIVWGRNDPFFTEAGIDYFKSLVPKAEVHLYDAGHFALETHVDEIAAEIREFLGHLGHAKRS